MVVYWSSLKNFEPDMMLFSHKNMIEGQGVIITKNI